VNEPECWGIFRERAHSPGREFDDAEILRLTGKHLDAEGFYVSLETPDEIPAAVPGSPLSWYASRLESTLDMFSSKMQNLNS
jgi:hypothetical protein